MTASLPSIVVTGTVCAVPSSNRVSEELQDPCGQALQPKARLVETVESPDTPTQVEALRLSVSVLERLGEANKAGELRARVETLLR